MLKNISFLALAGLLSTITTACVLTVDDSGDDVSDLDTTTSDTTTGDTTSETGTTDATTDTQGDIDTTADTGTTDATTDTGTTDATTDTGPVSMCGWDPNAMYYDCGFEGEDPSGVNPIGCPDGLVEGAPCADSGLSGEGCCDANGDNWYCAQGEVVFFNSCAG